MENLQKINSAIGGYAVINSIQGRFESDLIKKNTYCLVGSSVQYLSAGSSYILEPSLRHLKKICFLVMALAKLSSESESQMSASDA
jgi:hypothetical protein